MNNTDKKESFYITTSISYPNGKPHLGHAYELILADVFARYKSLLGYDVFFQSGVDEHGIKMQQTARNMGIDVKQLCDTNTKLFKQLVKIVDAKVDNFIRTTDNSHIKGSQYFWKAMNSVSKDIYKGLYEGWYSIRDEAFFDEEETIISDQGDRIGPNGTPVEWVKEETYFFKLSKYQDTLLKIYEDNPDFIQPKTRYNEIISFVKSGLKDLSISRCSFNWGVPVPGSKDHVMYVWVDALANYITGIGYPNISSDFFSNRWPADAHIIGKDVSRFHCVYWPAFLISAGLSIPKKVVTHGHLLLNHRKMSKSEGNIADPVDLVYNFGSDAFRYYFIRDLALNRDHNFDTNSIVERYNSELSNELGNLAHRSLSIISKDFEGKIPELLNLSSTEQELYDASLNIYSIILDNIAEYQLQKIIFYVRDLVKKANQYITLSEPWKKIKNEQRDEAGVILALVIEIVARAGLALQPVIPKGSKRLLDALQIDEKKRTFNYLQKKDLLNRNNIYSVPLPVFPKL